MKEFPFGAAGGEPRRILLAEDDAILQRIVTHILAQHGFQVVIANDGEEALDQVKTRRRNHRPRVRADPRGLHPRAAPAPPR